MAPWSPAEMTDGRGSRLKERTRRRLSAATQTDGQVGEREWSGIGERE